MRQLIIKRRKALAGCAGKVHVFIEDPLQGNVSINNCTCRKIGTLKNGEEATFSIGNEAAKIFVTGDVLTRNAYNDFCTIPAGDADVYLSGALDLNPGAGNPFRFDGEADEAMLKNRQRVRKNGKRLLVIAVIAGLITGLITSIGIPMLKKHILNQPKDFSVDGLNITLTKAFEATTEYGFDSMYMSDDAIVMVQHEDFTLLDGFSDLSAEEYGELLILSTPYAANAQLQDTNGIPWYEYNYTNPEDNAEFNYLVCVYKGTDAFWNVQFVSLKEDVLRMRPDFLEWASSVRFE